MRASTARLTQHRDAVRESGHTTQLLSVVDLTAAEKLLLFETVIARSHAEEIGIGTGEFYRLYTSVLTEWGVMCPHPDPTLTVRDSGWAVCGSCGCIVV